MGGRQENGDLVQVGVTVTLDEEEDVISENLVQKHMNDTRILPHWGIPPVNNDNSEGKFAGNSAQIPVTFFLVVGTDEYK
jgi:hypothetical protein